MRGGRRLCGAGGLFRPAAGQEVPGGGGGAGTGLDRFIPFLEFGPALRKVLYTTNAIESFNRKMRKVLKTRTSSE